MEFDVCMDTEDGARGSPKLKSHSFSDTENVLFSTPNFDVGTLCDRLRALVGSHMQQNTLESAKFFASILVTFSNGDLDDVLLLGNTYYANGEYRRVLNLVGRYKVLDLPKATKKLRLHYLTAKCLVCRRDVNLRFL